MGKLRGKPDFAYRFNGEAFTEDQVRTLVAFVKLEKTDGRSEQWKGQYGITNVRQATSLSGQRLAVVFAQLDGRGLIRPTMNTMYTLTTRGANYALQLLAWEEQK